MMSRSPPSRELPAGLNLRVTPADRPLLAAIHALVEAETDWNTSAISFDLLEPPIVAVTVHEKRTERLVACATVAASARRFSTWWVGFVVVARDLRRRGVATCVMNAVIDFACLRDDVHHLELLATMAGAIVYRSLAFENISEMDVCLMQYDTSQHQPCRHCSDDDVLLLTDVSNDLRNEAKQLYSTVVGGDRSRLVETLFNHATCLLQRDVDGAIQAIAWLRPVVNRSVETFWLGPVLSHDVRATKSLIQAAVSHTHALSTTLKTRLQTLSLNSSRIFEQEEFSRVRAVPLMRRETPPDVAAAEGRSEAANRRYYVSLCDYHIG